MVEEPVQSVQRHVLIDLLEYIERTRDRFVIGGGQAPRPLVLHEDADDGLELAFRFVRHVGSRHSKILNIGRREH